MKIQEKSTIPGKSTDYPALSPQTLSITHKFFDTHVNLKSYQTIFVDRAIHA
jgi:hypothetical protein